MIRDGILEPGTLVVDVDGSLDYSLTGVGCSAWASLRVRDDGGTERGVADTSMPVQFFIVVEPDADLQTAIDNDRSWLGLGQSVVYAIVVTNAGPNAVLAARVTDRLPDTLTSGSWVCGQQSSSASCPAPEAGIGDLDLQIDLAVGQHPRFELMAEEAAKPGASVLNTVRMPPPLAPLL